MLYILHIIDFVCIFLLTGIVDDETPLIGKDILMKKESNSQLLLRDGYLLMDLQQKEIQIDSVAKEKYSKNNESIEYDEILKECERLNKIINECKKK